MYDVLQGAELEEYAANMQIFPRSQFFVLSLAVALLQTPQSGNLCTMCGLSVARAALLPQNHCLSLSSSLCNRAWRAALSPKSPLILENTVNSRINLDERRATIQNLIHCLIKIFLYLSPMSNHQNVNPITWIKKKQQWGEEQCILAKLNFLYLWSMPKKTKIWSCSLVSNWIAPRKELALS